MGVVGAEHGWVDFADYEDGILGGAGARISSMAVVDGAGGGVTETEEGGAATLDPFMASLHDFASEEFTASSADEAAGADGFYALRCPAPGEASYLGTEVPVAAMVAGAYACPGLQSAAVPVQLSEAGELADASSSDAGSESDADSMPGLVTLVS